MVVKGIFWRHTFKKKKNKKNKKNNNRNLESSQKRSLSFLKYFKFSKVCIISKQSFAEMLIYIVRWLWGVNKSILVLRSRFSLFRLTPSYLLSQSFPYFFTASCPLLPVLRSDLITIWTVDKIKDRGVCRKCLLRYHVRKIEKVFPEKLIKKIFRKKQARKKKSNQINFKTYIRSS